MQPSERQFLKKALGTEGFKALLKASEREPQIVDVIVPRTIVAWLNHASVKGFSAKIPGNQRIHLTFAKNELGFGGEVHSGPNCFRFDDHTLHQLASVVALAIDHEVKPVAAEIRLLVLQKLGKSIDLLVKNQFETDNKAQMIFGDYEVVPSLIGRSFQILHRPTNKKICGGVPFKEAVDKAKGLVTQKAEAPGQTHSATPQKEPLAPKPPQKQPANKNPQAPKTVSLTKQECEISCSFCGGSLFQNRVFCGCVCFQELRSHVQTESQVGGVLLKFDTQTDAELCRLLVNTLKSGGNNDP